MNRSAVRSWCGRAAVILSACLAAAGCADPSTTTTPTPAALSAVVLSSTSVVGGTAVTATITLTGSAPAGGAAVTLTSSGTAVVVPATVTIPEGSNSQSFAVPTTASAAVITITATYAGSSQTATLTTTVVTVPAVQGFSLSNRVSMAGVPVQATVTLTAPAPAGGLLIALASSTAAATLPVSIVIPSGQTTATITIDIAGSPAATSATFTASGGGATRSATLTIGQLAFALAPGSVAGGLPDAAILSIPVPAPDGGAVVALSSNSPKVVVPATVTIPAGTISQSFSIATVDAPPTETATIVASYGGSTQSATLTVVAYPIVTAVSCNPATVTGGATIQCTGTLAAPASASGWRLTLASSDASVKPPAPLTTPPGTSTFQFSLTTTAVASATSVTIGIYDADSGFSLWTLGITVTP